MNSRKQQRSDSIRSEVQFDRPSTIAYLVPLTSINSGPTLFQGFDTCLIDGIDALTMALSLPCDAIDAFLPSLLRVSRRIHDECFRHHVFLIPIQALDTISIHDFPFVVVIGGERETIDLFKAEFVSRGIDACFLDVFSADHHANYITGMAQLKNYITSRASFIGLPLPPSFPQDDDPSLGVVVADHGVAGPNIVTLRSVGIDPKVLDPIDFCKHVWESPYEPRLQAGQLQLLAASKSAELIYRLRMTNEDIRYSEDIPSIPPGLSLVLAAPAILQELHDEEKWPKYLPDDQVFRDAVNLLRRQTGYHISAVHPTSKASEQALGIAQTIRTVELKLFALGVSAIGQRHFAAVFRLPHGSGGPHWTVKRLCRWVRSNESTPTKGLRKTRALVRKMSDEMRRWIPRQAIRLLRHHQTHVKIVGNPPLELLDIDGLPLILRHSLSKVPATPGNSFLKSALEYQLLNLRYEDLREILVLRSFPLGDVIADSLEEQLELMNSPSSIVLGGLLLNQRRSTGLPSAADGQRIFSLRIVDVRSIQDVVQTLNSFRGNVVVFDCHGGLDESGQYNVLKIGEEELRGWDLMGRARVPAIVLLSACDTHALQGSDGSLATGLLTAGALTVMATIFAVNGLRSASWIANVLHYGCCVVPLMLEQGRTTLRWNYVVTWAQRVSYCHDIIESELKGQSLLQSGMELSKIIVSSFLTLGFLEDRWLEPVLESLAKQVGCPVERLTSKARDLWLDLPDSVRYVQFGYPEAILLNAPPYEGDSAGTDSHEQ